MPLGAALLFFLAQPAAFDVVSIKPCKADIGEPGRGGPGSFTPESHSPGRLSLHCVTVRALIRWAYVHFAGSQNHFPAPDIPVDGGPSWLDSDRYDIETRAAGTPPVTVMMGPMMETLLADRFHLRLRRETREIPAYALTVAKGGPKLPPFTDGTCVLLLDDLLTKFPAPDPPTLAPGQRYCHASQTMAGGLVQVNLEGATLDQFRKMFLHDLGRPVIDKTGLTGRFVFRYSYAPEDDTAGTSLFAALQQQLGLRVEPAKGTGERIVVEHAERPTAN
jgi:uncharacterized protein (TIGR03435 family)